MLYNLLSHYTITESLMYFTFELFFTLMTHCSCTPAIVVTYVCVYL